MEEKFLIRKFFDGEESAFEKIEKMNRGLIFSIYKRHYRFNPSDEEDFIQEGRLGLLDAIKKFDLDKEESFAYLKSLYIRQRMSNLLRKKTRTNFLEFEDSVRCSETVEPRQERIIDSFFIINFLYSSGIKKVKKEIEGCLNFKAIKNKQTLMKAQSI